MTYILYINDTISIEHPDRIAMVSVDRLLNIYCPINNTIDYIMICPVNLTGGYIFKITDKNIDWTQHKSMTLFSTDNLLDFYNYILTSKTIERL